MWLGHLLDTGKVAAAGIVLLAGCRTWVIDRTDGEVYRLIEDRQQAAIGAASDVHLGPESGDLGRSDRMYQFNPRPIGADLPESFRSPGTERDRVLARDEARGSGGSGGINGRGFALEGRVDPVTAMTDSIFLPERMDEVITFGLEDALSQAIQHGRNLKNAKEDLYLEALDLTLERHLWTPQFVASVQADADYRFGRKSGTEAGSTDGEVDDAFSVVSDVAVSQRLPYGGDVTARVVANLVRDLDEHVTSGESGDLILEANIPLFRGAGRVAYESRYTAERELIYATRIYERFRRTFVVQVAAEYFSLQGLKAAMHNTFNAYGSRYADWEKSDFMNRMGRSRTVFEAPRAQSNLRQAEASLVNAKERYASAMDRFKILMGMPVEVLLDVLDLDADVAANAVDDLLPVGDEALAIETALRYRLDLLTSADQIDDARRGVRIGKNRILPDLDFNGSATFNSEPDHLTALGFNNERAVYRAGLQLRIDDRKTERNAYRASLVRLRRAERDHEEFTDRVRADVIRARRRVAQQESLQQIQALNVEENELRLAAARAQYDLGRSTNQDVVDAEEDLLDARNDYVRAVAAYRVAILELRRETGTLRVTDEGRWNMGGLAGAPVEEIPPEPGP